MQADKQTKVIWYHIYDGQEAKKKNAMRFKTKKKRAVKKKRRKHSIPTYNSMRLSSAAGREGGGAG